MCDKCGCGDAKADKTFEEQVKDAIEAVRPALQGHGGDVELVGVDEDNIYTVWGGGTDPKRKGVRQGPTSATPVKDRNDSWLVTDGPTAASGGR